MINVAIVVLVIICILQEKIMADVDKGLYEAPKSMEEMAQDEPDLEIEIVDPDEVNIDVNFIWVYNFNF